MNNSVKLLIALGFAAGAAILNFLWVQQNLPKYKGYTAYASDLDQSTVIDGDMKLRRIPLPERSDFKNSEMYIPWEDRGIIIGLKTPRAVKANELVLNTDVTSKEIPPKFSMLGPFRLLSVRDQFIKKNTSSEEQSQTSGSGSVVGRIPVTLIIPKQMDARTGTMTYDTKVEQLLHILELDQKSRSRNRETSIMAVVAMSGSTTNARDRDDRILNEDEVALVVDLPNVPVITDVLLNNPSPEIGFVVPASLVP